jgi:MFS family permease
LTPPLYPPRAKNLALVLLAMTQFVTVIDASIVNVALPSTGAALHFAPADLSWVVNAYVLTFGGFLLLGGRVADLLGRRRMFMLGLVVFSLASFAGGIAQSAGWLVAARAVQGLGAAMGAVASAGGAAGVLLSGILTSGLSWRWVLFVNVPIGLVAALLASRTLVESRAEDTRPSLSGPLRNCGSQATATETNRFSARPATMQTSCDSLAFIRSSCYCRRSASELSDDSKVTESDF